MLLDCGSWDGGTGAASDERRQPKAVRKGSPGGPRTRRTGGVEAGGARAYLQKLPLLRIPALVVLDTGIHDSVQVHYRFVYS